jgi:hypothetical protein
MFKEEPGTKVSLDFLPYQVTDKTHPDRDEDRGVALEGDDWWRRPYKAHRNVGPQSEGVVCPSSIGKKCPICDYRKKRQGEGADKDELAALTAKKRCLYIVVPRGEKDYDEEPHLWDISHHLFQVQLNEELDESPENNCFPDPDEGLTLRIRFGEKTMGKNKFAETSRVDFEERRDDITDKMLDAAPNLDEILTVLSYEELEKKFFELDAEEEAAKKEEAEVADRRERRRERSRDRDEDKEDKDKEERPSRRDRSRDKDEEKEDKDKDERSERRERRREREREPEKDEEKEDEGRGSRRERRRERDREDKDDDKKGEDRCPAPDGRFGVDTDKLKECEKCEIWESCISEKERREGKK